jgi:cation transport ATPase
MQLDRIELAQRLRSQGDNLVVQVAALVQGGVLSAAAFSLIEIFRIHDAPIERFVLWLISVIVGLLVFFRLCLRSPFLTRAGIDVIFMVPVMGVFEIVLFAILSTTALGADSWRYWFVAAVLLCAAAYLASWFNLRAVHARDYTDELVNVAPTLVVILRDTLKEMVGAMILTSVLGLTLLAMGTNWPYASVTVGLQLLFTLAVGPLTVLREARQIETLRRALDM